MNKNIGQTGVFAALALLFIAPVAAFAATSPISAKATYVEGSVSVLSAADDTTRAVQVGTGFAEGDKVTTSDDGIVEITFDTGDIIRLDNGTDLTIASLHRDEKGSTFSIFELAIGRVKSAVTKLVDKASRFEYHTRAAVCGVAGTPPFVVEANDKQTDVDLLGKKGDPGKVYVQSTGGNKKRVFLIALTRTIVRFGEDPMDPFPISAERMRMFKKFLFEFEKKKGKKLTDDEIAMMKSLARRVSLPRPPDPGESKTLEDLERMYDQGRGIYISDPEPALTRGSIKIDLR